MLIFLDKKKNYNYKILFFFYILAIFLFMNTKGFDCKENGNFFGIDGMAIDDDKLLLFS